MRRDRHNRSKVDANQPDIVEELRKIPGVTVEVNHSDILVGLENLTYWFEIKEESIYKQDGSLKKGALKDSQIKLLDQWEGHYSIAWNLDMILKEIGIP